MNSNRNSPSHPDNKFVVIGAGPVGLLTALAINKVHPNSVTVFERRPNLDQELAESYPIGVSLRGLRAIKLFAPDSTRASIEENGRIVNSWDVFVKGFQVASVPSGVTLGHTRASVVSALFDAAKQQGIDVRFGHKLSGVDVHGRSVSFERTDESGTTTTTVRVDCTNSILIAADGSNSVTRKFVLDVLQPLKLKITPWKTHFRTLLIDSCPMEDVPLDPNVHAIHMGVYCAVTSEPGSDSERKQRWIVVPSAKSTSDDDKAWIMQETDNPSPEDMYKLREHIAGMVPPLRDTHRYFSEKEIKAFFGRRTFTGSLVSLAPLHFPYQAPSDSAAGEEKENEEPSGGAQGESAESWIAFLGDSAHGVFPATGEGLNSGLDDVLVFAQSVLWPTYGVPDSVSADLIPASLSSSFEPKPLDLSAFTSARQEDVDALALLAAEILQSQSGATPSERIANVLAQVIASAGRKLNIIGPSEAELRYGPASAKELVPYSEVWRRNVADTALIRSSANSTVGFVVLVWNLMSSLIVPWKRRAHSKLGASKVVDISETN